MRFRLLDHAHGTPGDRRRWRARAQAAGLLAVASLAITAAPASARTLPIQMSATGSATSLGCLGGGVPPCVERVVYDGQTSDTPSPFSAFSYFKQPVALRGFLDFPVTSSGTCEPGLAGVLQILAARGGGSRERVAFEVIPTPESTATCGSGMHSLTAAFQVDSTGSGDPAFRDAVGSGVISLSDAPGVFSADLNGTIEVRR